MGCRQLVKHLEEWTANWKFCTAVNRYIRAAHLRGAVQCLEREVWRIWRKKRDSKCLCLRYFWYFMKTMVWFTHWVVLSCFITYLTHIFYCLYASECSEIFWLTLLVIQIEVLICFIKRNDLNVRNQRIERNLICTVKLTL